MIVLDDYIESIHEKTTLRCKLNINADLALKMLKSERFLINGQEWNTSWQRLVDLLSVEDSELVDLEFFR